MEKRRYRGTVFQGKSPVLGDKKPGFSAREIACVEEKPAQPKALCRQNAKNLVSDLPLNVYA